jgi:hypothetical protein
MDDYFRPEASGYDLRQKIRKGNRILLRVATGPHRLEKQAGARCAGVDSGRKPRQAAGMPRCAGGKKKGLPEKSFEKHQGVW